MNEHLNNNNEPVCKFGPGGDFVSNWPPKSNIAPITDVITKTTVTTVSQSSLFADDLAIPIRTVHKKKPQIRVHRRTPKNEAGTLHAPPSMRTSVPNPDEYSRTGARGKGHAVPSPGHGRASPTRCFSRRVRFPARVSYRSWPPAQRVLLWSAPVRVFPSDERSLRG